MQNICEEDISQSYLRTKVLVHLVKANLDQDDQMSGVSSLVYGILCQDDLAGGLRANCSHIYVLIKKTNNIECLIENLVNLAETGGSKVFMQFMEKFSKIF